MMVADEGQMEESWRVERTATGTLVRGTSENPMLEKNDLALVVARKISPPMPTFRRVASTIACPRP
jgi:hypothetical protein